MLAGIEQILPVLPGVQRLLPLYSKPGQFAIANLIKLKLVKKKATKAGKKPNPFKPGEMMDVKAKPASVKVKPVVLKRLKDLKVGK